jgi:hypothetical protein
MRMSALRLLCRNTGLQHLEVTSDGTITFNISLTMAVKESNSFDKRQCKV